MMRAMRHSGLLSLIVLLVLPGCRQQMADQPRYEPYEASGFFRDSTSMRHPVAGTVPRESLLGEAYRPNRSNAEGLASRRVDEGSEADRSPDGAAYRGGYPFAITELVLQRGRNRYDIYCSPCHGRDGYGAGIIVQRGLRRPPSFHSERLRAAAPGHFYDVITEGFGSMYSYASRVAPADRWAITAYIQALQLSQNAGAGAVPADTLDSLSAR